MKRNKINILVVFTFVAVLAGLSVLAYYKITDIAESRIQLQSKQVQLTKLTDEVAIIKANIIKYQNEQEEFKKYLFTEKDVPAFLDGISLFASQSQINILDMKTQRFEQVVIPDEVGQMDAANKQRNILNRNAKQQTQEEKPMVTLAAMPINIQIKGTFASFVDFFSRLEEFEQLITVSKIDIETKNEYPLLKCDFTLKIYSFKTVEELSYR